MGNFPNSSSHYTSLSLDPKNFFSKKQTSNKVVLGEMDCKTFTTTDMDSRNNRKNVIPSYCNRNNIFTYGGIKFTGTTAILLFLLVLF